MRTHNCREREDKTNHAAVSPLPVMDAALAKHIADAELLLIFGPVHLCSPYLPGQPAPVPYHLYVKNPPFSYIQSISPFFRFETIPLLLSRRYIIPRTEVHCFQL